jgi:hypothetical protein
MGSPLVSDWPQVSVKRPSLISLWLDFQVKILKMPAWDQKARRDSSSDRLKSYGTVVGFPSWTFGQPPDLGRRE